MLIAGAARADDVRGLTHATAVRIKRFRRDRRNGFPAMTIRLTTQRISSDRSQVCATSVGDGRWVFVGRARGWTLNHHQALGLMVLVDAVDGCPAPYPTDHPIWREIERWLRPVALSPREAIALLDLAYDPQRVPDRVSATLVGRGGRWRRPAVVAALARWWHLGSPG